ncbi:unnamed protein product [Boreogadus saida]
MVLQAQPKEANTPASETEISFEYRGNFSRNLQPDIHASGPILNPPSSLVEDRGLLVRNSLPEADLLVVVLENTLHIL